MIKICGQNIKNCPSGMEDCLDVLMMGIVESQCMHFIKTSQYVYGKTEDEIIEYAKLIKELDSTYDIVSIYTDMDDYTKEREFKTYKSI